MPGRFCSPNDCQDWYINSMNITEKYLEAFAGPVDPLLEELERETYAKVLYPQMLCGRQQGIFLELISRMIRPSTILEIGTFTGYSTICLARGLREGGTLHTLEANDELEAFSASWFRKAGLTDRIVQHSGRAQDLLPELNIKVDLLYIDGDKREYPDYYQMAAPLVKKEGFILIDNVLWDGKVYDPKETDPHTLGIRELTERIQSEAGMFGLILPLRDGLMLLQKR